MKRKILSLLLCIAVIVSGMPVGLSAIFADTGEKEAPILAYVPLDNRPVNVDRVIYEAESAGFKVAMPDEDMYATRLDGQPKNFNGTQYGDSQKLLAWIKEMDEKTDYFVISLDQLLSGGLVNSRAIYETDCRKEFQIIDAIVELSKENRVYIVDTVLRLATCTVGYQNASLDTYNYLRQYTIKPRATLKGSGLTISRIVSGYTTDQNHWQINIVSSYHQEVMRSLHTRERKLKLIDYILAQDTEGKMKYFIGIDDSSAENTIQTNEINFIKEKMGERGLIYSGTDELGMMAVLGLMLDYYNYDVKAAPVYFGNTESTQSGSAYDLEPVKENVEKHLASLGVQLAPPEEADMEIVVLTTPEKTTLTAKYINDMIDYINANIAKGTPTIVINSAPGAYGGNLEYRMIRECEMSMLLSYSSWGTVGNSIGLAMSNGISRYLYLHSAKSSSAAADSAFLKGLIFSYEKDISYIRGGGKTLFNTYLEGKGWPTSNFYQSDDQVREINAALESMLKTSEYNVTVNDVINNMTGCRYLKGLSGACGIIGDIGISNYSAPFFRTYEIHFDISVDVSDVTVNLYNRPVKVVMPYTQEGELVYSFNLYFLDQDGKFHKVPASYDPAAGSASFTTDRLPGFYTSALSMNAEKAHSLFTDVAQSDWYFIDVLYVYEKGLMKGTSASTFEPKATMTRAMLVNTLYNMAGANQTGGAIVLPADAKSEWYKPALSWALSKEIAICDPEGNFGPNVPITRELLAEMLFRYEKSRGVSMTQGGLPGAGGYGDYLMISESMRPAMDWACKEGILAGSGNMLMPQASATRAEVAAVLKRYLEK